MLVPRGACPFGVEPGLHKGCKLARGHRHPSRGPGRQAVGRPSGWLLDSQQSLPDTWLPQPESAAAPSMFRSLSGAEVTAWRQAPRELWEVTLTVSTNLSARRGSREATVRCHDPHDQEDEGKQGDDTETRPSLRGGVTGA